MKSFATQRQKRGGEDVAKVYYGSPSKKMAVVNFVKVLQINPYTLGAYFIKEDGASGYYWPLITGLDKNESWCKDLQIGMTVRRRAVGGNPTEVMKVKTSTRYINCHMFLRFLEEDEIKDSKKIAEKWGSKLANAMSVYFSRKHREEIKKNTTNVFPAEKFICHDVTDSVENLSDLVVQYDVVLVMKVLFKDSISSKEFFEDNELTTLFFPGVADVKSLFKYHM